MDLDRAGVETFLEVAERRHFGVAAEKLGIAVAAVTQRIERLEDSLGIPLIDADSGGFLGLTPAGHRLVQCAPQLDSTAMADPPALAAPVSTLRLAVPAGPGVVAPLLPSALATVGLLVRQIHPGVAVETVPTPFERLVPTLLAGEVDAVLTFSAAVEPDIESTRLSEIHRVAVVGRSHPLAPKRAVPVAVFAKLPILCAPGLPEAYLAPYLLADVRPLDQADLCILEASDSADVVARLRQGLEATVVPLALTADLPPELKRIGLVGCPPSWYHALRRRGDDRDELLTAIALAADFTESLSRVAQR
jgi:DNA-binding transcriptional LysR family regulator